MMDVEKFWLERNKHRALLDKKMAQLPFSKKLEIAEKLRKDAILLKSGRLINK